MYAFIAENMYVSTDTVAKWSYAKVHLRYDRLQDLVRLFSLGPQHVFLPHPERLHFQHIPLDMVEIKDYYRYIAGLAQRLTDAVTSTDVLICFQADEIPIFHFMPYSKLTYFKLYTYAYNKLKIDLQFEEFMESLEAFDLAPFFQQIASSYDRIPSVEIWDDYILDDMLFHIEHFDILDRFKVSESRDALLDELIMLVDDFRVLATSGEKSTGVRFDFFRKPTAIRTGYMLLRSNEQMSLSIKIDTINSISTADPDFVDTYWLSFKSSIDKSMALGIGAERDRVLYFKDLTRKIEELKQA